MNLFTILLGVAAAWNGQSYQPFQDGHAASTESPNILISTYRTLKSILPGEWHNCQTIRIDENIWEHQSLTGEGLPEIYLTTEGVCSYAITGPTDEVKDYFKLLPQERADLVPSVQLKLLQKLDRESRNFHMIQISAFDCQNNVVDSKEVRIVVGDINDHAPWFKPESLQMEMCPDTKQGTVIGRLLADDADIGVYSDIQFQKVYRKPVGADLHVTYRDGSREIKPHIFGVNAKSGEMIFQTTPTFDLSKVRYMTFEMGVRDHPGNPVFGSRSSQVIVKMCNQAPSIMECHLGTVDENSPVGTILRDGKVLIQDSDSNIDDKEIGFEQIKKFGGKVKITGVRDGDITTGTAEILEAFDYEAIKNVEGVGGVKTAQVEVIFSNPRARLTKQIVGNCTISIRNVVEAPHIVRRNTIFFAENCAAHFGKCSAPIEIEDPDNSAEDMEYISMNEFFDAKKDPSGGLILCNKLVFDREKDCTHRMVDDDHYYMPVRVIVTKSVSRMASPGELVYVRCEDVNDNAPTLLFSSVPIPDSFCTNAGRNFSDTKFLEKHDIDPALIDFSINKQADTNIVALALVEDPDDGSVGNAYNFEFTVESENNDFQVLPTGHKYLFFVVRYGTDDIPDKSEVSISVRDGGKYEGYNAECLPHAEALHEGGADEPFFHVLTGCDCDSNEDTEYYPSEYCRLSVGGGILIVLLLLLILGLLLALCYFCHRVCCVAPIVDKEEKILYKYDKPDWYYYLYNIMSTNKKHDLVVDDAAVDHPPDVKTLLIRSKEEADSVLHTYDDQKVYAYEKVHKAGAVTGQLVTDGSGQQTLPQNRDSLAFSQVSDVSKLTAGIGQTGDLNWNELLHGVPVMDKLPYMQRPAAAAGSRHSEVSDLTDITVNYNGTQVLSNDVPELNRILLTHTERDVLTSRHDYTNGLHHQMPRTKFGTAEQINSLHRSKSPSALMRNTTNTISNDWHKGGRAIQHSTQNVIQHSTQNVIQDAQNISNHASAVSTGQSVSDRLFSGQKSSATSKTVSNLDQRSSYKTQNAQTVQISNQTTMKQSGILNSSKDSQRTGNFDATIETMKSTRFVKSYSEDEMSDLSYNPDVQGDGFQLRSDFHEDTRTVSRMSSDDQISRSRPGIATHV